MIIRHVTWLSHIRLPASYANPGDKTRGFARAGGPARSTGSSADVWTGDGNRCLTSLLHYTLQLGKHGRREAGSWEAKEIREAPSPSPTPHPPPPQPPTHILNMINQPACSQMEIWKMQWATRVKERETETKLRKSGRLTVFFCCCCCCCSELSLIQASFNCWRDLELGVDCPFIIWFSYFAWCEMKRVWVPTVAAGKIDNIICIWMTIKALCVCLLMPLTGNCHLWHAALCQLFILSVQTGCQNSQACPPDCPWSDLLFISFFFLTL